MTMRTALIMAMVRSAVLHPVPLDNVLLTASFTASASCDPNVCEPPTCERDCATKGAYGPGCGCNEGIGGASVCAPGWSCKGPSEYDMTCQCDSHGPTPSPAPSPTPTPGPSPAPGPSPSPTPGPTPGPSTGCASCSSDEACYATPIGEKNWATSGDCFACAPPSSPQGKGHTFWPCNHPTWCECKTAGTPPPPPPPLPPALPIPPADDIGWAPRNCLGHLRDNEVNWNDGYASVTYYEANGLGDGAFSTNFGDEKGSCPDASDCGVDGRCKNGDPCVDVGLAYSSVAFSTEMHKVSKPDGLCFDGITAAEHQMPTDANGKNICFELSQGDQKVTGMITENCGGNCASCTSSTECNTSPECKATDPNFLLNPDSCQLKPENRCSAGQGWDESTFPNLKATATAYNDKYDLVQQKWSDWCSGVVPHFDVGGHKQFEKLCGGSAGFCEVHMKRIPCPSKLPTFAK